MGYQILESVIIIIPGFKSRIKEYHRQYLYAATHPYTTIMAHYLWWDDGLLPNWWGVKGVENPFLDFSVISQTMRSELKVALLEHQTALLGMSIWDGLRICSEVVWCFPSEVIVTVHI